MPRKRVLLADSSSLIALDRRGNLSILRDYVTLVPRAVQKEIVVKALAIRPDSPVYPEVVASANRFRYYIERGDIRVLNINYVKFGTTLDRARKRLARLENSEEHRVPKADAEMAAGIAHLLEEGQGFEVLCEDALLIRVLKAMFHGVAFVTSEDLVREGS